MVEGGGFEPPKLSRQIYSLIPLATREPLRKAAYCPDAIPGCQPLLSKKIIDLRTPCFDGENRSRESGRGAARPAKLAADRLGARAGNGAGERNRTPDPLITNQPLYQLSYASNDLQVYG